MSKKGKCKIDIKFIQDDRKRTDTLYKRRRGLIKKVHELSVICRLKISIVCTDFERTCFTYSNDERLDYNLERVLGDINKPIWLTRFLPEDYPFSSVKGDTKEKVLFGRRVNQNCLIKKNKIFKPHKPTVPSKALLSKRGLSELVQTTTNPQNQQNQQIPKKLKIDQLAPLSTNQQQKETEVKQQIDKNLYLTFNHKFKNTKAKIPKEQFEDYLVISLRKTIDNLKKDYNLINKYFKFDQKFFVKLEKFREKITTLILSERFFQDHLMLRYFIYFYFSNESKGPFDIIKKISPPQILKIMSKIDSIEVDKVNEVFLRVMFSKINPQRNFDFLAEIKKIKFCSKLYSLKRVHLKRVMVGRASGNTKFPKIQKEIEKNLTNPKKRQKPSCIVAEEIFIKHHANFVIIQDNWLAMTINEIIGMGVMQNCLKSFLNRVPLGDLKKIAILISGGLMSSKVPFLQEVLAMQKKKNEISSLSEGGGQVPGGGFSDFMDLLQSGNNGEQNFSDNVSQASGFSFNFQETVGSLRSSFFEF